MPSPIISVFTKYRYKKKVGDQVVETATLNYVPGSNLDCAAIEASFVGLTVSQALARIAASTVNPPDTPEGYVAVLRDCSGIVTTPWVADTDDGSDLLDEVPGWATPLQYSYNGGTLVIEATTSIGQVKFERADGTPFTTTNADGVTINSGTFYSYGDLSGQGSFVRQWAANLSVNAYKITVQQDGGTDTYTYTFTPTPGASHVSL